MAIAGMRGSLDWGTDEVPKNFREMILWRNPNGQAPLTALLSRMKSEKTDNPEFAWWEEELNPIRLKVNGAVTTGATTIVVSTGDATNLVAGDVLLVEAIGTNWTETYSNEIVVVATAPNSTTMTVTRGQASTAAATIPDLAFISKIGNVYEEGSVSPNASSRNPTKNHNFTQIFKTAYRITNTAKLVNARTGDGLKNDKKRKMFDHSVAMELAFLFGKRHEDTTGTKPRRFTGGLTQFLATADAAGATHCVKVWTTTPTEDTFLNAIYQVFDYDSGSAGNERIVFAGNGFLNSLNKLARNSSSTRVNFDGSIKAYGMQLQRWILPQGTLYVRTHPLMNTHGEFSNAAFIIDPSAIVYRYLRDTTHQDNIQANDADEQKGQWLSECGLEFRHVKTCSLQLNFVV